MPSDPARRAVFQVQVARLEERKLRKDEKAENTAAPAVAPEKDGSAPADGSTMAASDGAGPATNGTAGDAVNSSGSNEATMAAAAHR